MGNYTLETDFSGLQGSEADNYVFTFQDIVEDAFADSGSTTRLLGNLMVMERYINTIRQGLAASGLKISSGLECADGLLWDYLEGHVTQLDFQDFANDYYACFMAHNAGIIEKDAPKEFYIKYFAGRELEAYEWFAVEWSSGLLMQLVSMAGGRVDFEDVEDWEEIDFYGVYSLLDMLENICFHFTSTPLTLNGESDYTQAESQVHQTVLFQERMRHIQSDLRTAASASPAQYALLRNEYKNYTILPKQYAAELLAKSQQEGIKPFYLSWLEKASEQGVADAQYELALIYYRGTETPASYRDKAISLLKKAAENGKDEAALDLGKMYGYQYTHDFPQDREQSLYWFDFAAKAGNAEAMQNLYDIYKSGIWVPKDMQKALYYLEMSCEGASSSALNELGECYFNGREVSQDYEKAFELFSKNCEGDWYETETRNEALYKLQSLYWLGVCYENGFGTEKNGKKALESYEMAAAKNISMAQDRLGMLYKEGNLVPRNLKKAIEWLKLAAEELHYEMAQYHLGMCFFYGDGVKKDLQKAAELFDKSARQYCAEAQYMSGLCRENGWGIKFSLKQAKKMYEKAAEQGYVPAVEKLEQMNQSG